MLHESSPTVKPPDVLMTRRAWCCWRLEERDGKPSKVPYNPRTGRRAKSNDASTWVDYATALAAAPRYEGLGIFFSDGLCGVDLDKCRDPESGLVEAWAQGIVDALNSYTETSPSGTGVHVILFGELPTGRRKRGLVEAYDASSPRYFCWTGNHLAGTSETVERRQDALTTFHALHLAGPPAVSPVQPPGNGDSHPVALDANKLLDVAFRAANGPRIRALFNAPGDAGNSEGDAALAGLLAFYSGGDPARLEQLMRASARVRPKWATLRAGKTWIQRECEQAVARHSGDCYTPGGNAGEAAADDGEGKTGPQVVRLLRLAAEAGVETFRDGSGGLWASAPVGGHRENFPMAERGGGIRHWLANRFVDSAGRPPSSTALAEATSTLHSAATEGPVHEVALRIAEADGELWLDLADAERRVVRITREGWSVVTDAPAGLRFYRPTGQAALPTPSRTGNLQALRAFVNSSEEDFRLVAAWLLACLRPGYPYPVLSLNGEQGAGKSTLARLLRLCVDPQGPTGDGLSRPPADDRDLFSIVTSNHILAFDNLTHLSPDMSDSLSALSTGAGLQKRRLYSDADVHSTYARRAIVLTGIGEVAERPDLLDRALVVVLKPIPDAKRLPEALYWEQARAAVPEILGGLLDAAAVGLRNLPETFVTPLPRMADFATFVVAAEPAMPWEPGDFMDAYCGNRQDAVVSVLESDAFSRLLLEEGLDGFVGTMSELLRRLEDQADEREIRARTWPRNARAASERVTRLAPALRASGVDVDIRKSNGVRRLTLTPAGAE